MKRTRTLLVALIISLLLAACGNDQLQVSPQSPENTAAHTETLAPTPTATEIPPLVLNICTAEEPVGLYRYDGSTSQAKQSIFSAIYIDLLETEPDTNRSLFFESIPTEENGDILLQAVPVKVGQPVLDAAGNVVYLAEGTLIEHAINISVANPVTWNFEQDYQMNQFTVTFKLLPGLKWSDGETLVAEDFVFSYHLAERSRLGHYQWALERTNSLIAVDEQTLIWTGIPGFVPRHLEEILWQPLPSHQLKDFSDAELIVSELTTRIPVGWGAYRLVNWNAGNQIVLEKNPHFIMAQQGIPAYDELVFQVEPELEAALQKLHNGQCDVLDKTYRLEALEKSQLETLSTENRLIAENWEPVQQLVFGIQPAAYDDGLYSQWTSERQDIFGDLETRKAIAACIDADSLVMDYLTEHLPEDLIPPQANLPSQSSDPNTWLEEIGWILTSGDEGMQRSAQGVPNVLDGTYLRFNLSTGQSLVDQRISEEIIDRLEACGISVTKLSMPLAELYRPGPEGSLFGRNFDMALVSWQPEHLDLCQMYTSDQVPSSINSWVGTNLAGLSSTDFDEACWENTTWLSGEDGQDSAVLMAEYLPAIPLMPHYRLWVASDRISLPEDSSFLHLWQFSPAR